MAQAATHTRTFANMVSITPVSIRRPSLRLFPPPSWSSSESSGKFNWLALCRPRPSLSGTSMSGTVSCVYVCMYVHHIYTYGVVFVCVRACMCEHPVWGATRTRLLMRSLFVDAIPNHLVSLFPPAHFLPRMRIKNHTLPPPPACPPARFMKRRNIRISGFARARGMREISVSVNTSSQWPPMRSLHGILAATSPMNPLCTTNGALGPRTVLIACVHIWRSRGGWARERMWGGGGQMRLHGLEAKKQRSDYD